MSNNTKSKKIIRLNQIQKTPLSETNTISLAHQKNKSSQPIFLPVSIGLLSIWTIFTVYYIYSTIPPINLLINNPDYIIKTSFIVFLPLILILFSIKLLSEIVQTKKINSELLENLKKITSPNKEYEHHTKTLSKTIQSEINKLNQAIKTGHEHLVKMKQQVKQQVDDIDKTTESVAYQTSKSYQTIETSRESLSDLIAEIHHGTKKFEMRFDQTLKKLETGFDSAKGKGEYFNGTLQNNEHQLDSYMDQLKTYENSFKNTQNQIKQDHSYFKTLSDEYQLSINDYLSELKEKTKHTGDELVKIIKYYMERTNTVYQHLENQTKLSYTMNDHQIKKLKSISDHSSEIRQMINETGRQATFELQKFDEAMRKTLKNLVQAVQIVHEETDVISTILTKQTNQLEENSAQNQKALNTNQDQQENESPNLELLTNISAKNQIKFKNQDRVTAKIQKQTSILLPPETAEKLDTLAWLEKIPPLTEHSNPKIPNKKTEIEKPPSDQENSPVEKQQKNQINSETNPASKNQDSIPTLTKSWKEIFKSIDKKQ